MSSSQLFYMIQSVCLNAKDQGKGAAEIIGCLLLVANWVAAETVKVTPNEPKIVRAGGLPPNPQNG